MTTTESTQTQEKPVKSLIPARMHDMPWVKFHWLVIFGLGTAWILDGLEAQIVAAGGFEKTLDMSAADVGLAGTVYLVGQVVGAVLFGRLTDSWGRKRLFTLTLALYLVAAAAAGLAPNMTLFLVFRFISGMGIGGEYSAVNSAVDELIPGASGAGSTSRSTARTGPARPSAPSPRRSSSTPTASGRTSAGASRSSSGRCSASASSTCAGTSPRARAGW